MTPIFYRLLALLCSHQSPRRAWLARLLWCSATVVVLVLALPESGRAASRPDFRIGVRAMSLAGASIESTTQRDGSKTEQSEETLALQTFPEGIELAAFFDDWALYTYPGQNTAALMLGYSGWSGFEWGPLVSVRFDKRRLKRDGRTIRSEEGSPNLADPSRNNLSLGAYAFYGFSFGATAAWALEFTLTGWYGKQSGRLEESSTNEGTTGGSTGSLEQTKSSLSATSTTATFDVTLPVMLADKFEFAPGVSIVWSMASAQESKTNVADVETDSEALGWALTAARFRYTF